MSVLTVVEHHRESHPAPFLPAATPKAGLEAALQSQPAVLIGFADFSGGRRDRLGGQPLFDTGNEVLLPAQALNLPDAQRHEARARQDRGGDEDDTRGTGHWGRLGV